MSAKIPADLVNRRNDHVLVMDRYNVSHRAATVGVGYRGACGLPGSPVTLAQAIAYSTPWCSHPACYGLTHPGRGGSR